MLSTSTAQIPKDTGSMMEQISTGEFGYKIERVRTFLNRQLISSDLSTEEMNEVELVSPRGIDNFVDENIEVIKLLNESDLIEQLLNIQNLIRLTKTNVEELNSLFSRTKHPPVIYLSDYERLCTRINDYQGLQELLLDQLTPDEQIRYQEIVDEQKAVEQARLRVKLEAFLARCPPEVAEVPIEKVLEGKFDVRKYLAKAEWLTELESNELSMFVAQMAREAKYSKELPPPPTPPLLAAIIANGHYELNERGDIITYPLVQSKPIQAYGATSDEHSHIKPNIGQGSGHFYAASRWAASGDFPESSAPLSRGEKRSAFSAFLSWARGNDGRTKRSGKTSRRSSATEQSKSLLLESRKLSKDSVPVMETKSSSIQDVDVLVTQDESLVPSKANKSGLAAFIENIEPLRWVRKKKIKKNNRASPLSVQVNGNSAQSDMDTERAQIDAEYAATISSFGKVIRAHLPNNQRTTVPVCDGQSLRETLDRTMRRRKLTFEMCSATLIETNEKLSWSTDVARYEGKEIRVETLECYPLQPRISHNYVRKTFFTLTFCDCCNKLVLSGFRCQTCGLRFHLRCSPDVPPICQPMVVPDNYYRHLLSLNSDTFNLSNNQLVKMAREAELLAASGSGKSPSAGKKSWLAAAFGRRRSSAHREPPGKLDEETIASIAACAVKRSREAEAKYLASKAAKTVKADPAAKELEIENNEELTQSRERSTSAPNVVVNLVNNKKVTDEAARVQNIIEQKNVEAEAKEKLTNELEKIDSKIEPEAKPSQTAVQNKVRVSRRRRSRSHLNKETKEPKISKKKPPTSPEEKPVFHLRRKREKKEGCNECVTDSEDERVRSFLFRADSMHEGFGEWEILDREIALNEKVGTGSYGTVYSGHWHGPVALKQLNIVRTSDYDLLRAFRNEVNVLRRIRHSNIVLFMGCVTKPDLTIVMQLCQGSTLYRVLHLDEQLMTAYQVIKISQQIAHGMDYLHAKFILHRDLKSPNIFLQSDFGVRIGDFGMATLKSHWNGENDMVNPNGSIYWMAPEVVRLDPPDPYSFASDVYSFGIVMYELLSGLIPYPHGRSTQQVMWMVGRGFLKPDLSKVPKAMPANIKNLMMQCIDRKRDNRPGFRQITNKLDALEKTTPKILRSLSEPLMNHYDDCYGYSINSPVKANPLSKIYGCFQLSPYYTNDICNMYFRKKLYI